MFRYSHIRRNPNISDYGKDPSAGTPDRFHEVAEAIPLHNIRRRLAQRKFSIKALTYTRLQAWIGAVGVLVAAGFVLGPWLWGELKEATGFRFVPVDASHMPRMSPLWWENEWRKMNPMWRKGETEKDFFVSRFNFIKEHTGRDLFSGASFVESDPNQSAKNKYKKGSWWFTVRNKIFGSSSNPQKTIEDKKELRPQVLVPCCGDSPIVKVMAERGYEVDAVDCSKTALQTAAEKTEVAFPKSLYKYVHYNLNDIFSAELWNTQLKNKKYDVIYERQGITSLNLDQREDYAFLLKRALKDDGILYFEGIFRTGRVKGNKVQGPPFGISRKEIQHLFPASEGFYVRCEEKPDAILSLSRENRILRRVPKDLYVTPFNCVIFRENAVNLEIRDSLAQRKEEKSVIKL